MATGQYAKRLFGTTWVEKTYGWYNKQGKAQTFHDYSKQTTYMTAKDKFYMLRSEPSPVIGYELYIDKPSEKATTVKFWQYYSNDSICFDDFKGRIIRFSDNEFAIRNYYPDGDYFEYVFEKASERVHYIYGNENSSSVAEKPEIGFYGYTATNTSITVTFVVYNDVKFTYPYIYYGTTSNPKTRMSAQVIGKHIKATITGLKAGTNYYVKASASNVNGITYTDVVKVATLY